MDVFQSHMEALAFNYVSFEYLASLQSLLTCIAILTAAISFWRIRTLGSNSLHRIKSSGDSPSSLDRSCCFAPNISSPPPMQAVSTWSEKESDEEVEEEEVCHQEQIACSSFVGVGAIVEYDDKEDNGNGISIIENKFALYFEGEQSECDGDRGGVDVVCSYYRKELYCDGGIKTMGRRREFGWYNSQDLTVFNGSVVRLWDCHRR